MKNDPTGIILQLSTNFQLVFGTIVPFLIIIGSNIVIILTIRAAAKARLKMQNRGDNIPEKARNESEFLTRMLIFASLAYVVTSIPYRLFQVILQIPQIQAQFDMNDFCDFIFYIITITACYALWVWNFAVNFYMYVIGGGKRYRKDVKEIFDQCFK